MGIETECAIVEVGITSVDDSKSFAGGGDSDTNVGASVDNEGGAKSAGRSVLGNVIGETRNGAAGGERRTVPIQATAVVVESVGDGGGSSVVEVDTGGTTIGALDMESIERRGGTNTNITVIVDTHSFGATYLKLNGLGCA